MEIEAQDFHVTSNECKLEHLNVVDGTYDPGDSTTPGHCQTIGPTNDPWLDINYLTTRNITTVYVMGSDHPDTKDDL